jgi:hypothetical protein
MIIEGVVLLLSRVTKAINPGNWSEVSSIRASQKFKSGIVDFYCGSPANLNVFVVDWVSLDMN